MRNRTPLLLAAVLMMLAALATTGCQTLVKTESVADNLPPVLTRHDAYAQAQLEGEALANALADSNAARATFEANRQGYLPETINAYVVPVLARHNTWVRADTTLAEVARSVYLDSSKALGVLFAPKEE